MKNPITAIIALAIIFTLTAAAIYYISNRCAFFFPSIPRKMWIGGFASLFLLAILCTGIGMSQEVRPLCFVGGIIVPLLLFLLLSVAAVDFISLFVKFAPQVRGIFSVSLAVMLTVLGVWSAHSIKIKEVTIPLDGLTQEIRAIHLTDVHLGNLWGEKRVEKIVAKINELAPDVVFNTGDMFDSKCHFKAGNDVLAAFRDLKVPHYFVYGNHDEYVGVEEVITRMKAVNATVLRNETANFGELQIIGLDNMLPDENASDPTTKLGNETIKSVLSRLSIDENRPTLVLHHRPDGINYMYDKKADLLLAGHTHAGQLFPFTLFAKLIFKYNSGLYRYKTMNIYVSDGAGTIGMPVRLGMRSEMTVIRLVPKNVK
jgi:predicted MPP superfamily phosphohydrolase